MEDVEVVSVMTPKHPRWPEFIEILEGPTACNFRREPPESEDPKDFKWSCKGGIDKTFTIRILRSMGFSIAAIVRSCIYFEQHGGFCDCEISFNVKPRTEPLVRRRTRKNPPRRPRV